ncbi:DNA-binding domain-containing protein [Dyella japonica]|uniref:Putative DNA-binding domain-containing protein n=1 Tax=Dyella japonica A8 TaxID=1217721 RepID=A0A075JX05_9GAMM|nr:DNA-binding domain-containing protein [Dyella japonica]AIF46631.1 hypothetical protein HY57_04805 [Dyella japonica A8]
MSGLRAMQRQLADALRADAMPHLASLHGDGVADATSRLAVYHHGYRLRLVEALRTEFPGLALLAGKRFANVLHDYVTAHPSTHFNIRWHGEGLADFLAYASPWCERPALAEMAQLDWAISTAFDAADHPTITASELAHVPPDGWATLRLHPLPHARVLRVTHNIAALRRAADRGTARPALRRLRQPRHLLVWRPALEVRYRPVAPAEFPALQAALHGETFAKLCERLAQRHGARSALPRMAALLGQWMNEGLIGRLDTT